MTVTITTRPSKEKITQVESGEIPFLFSSLELSIDTTFRASREYDDYQWLLDFVERHESLEQVSFSIAFSGAVGDGIHAPVLGVLQRVARLCARLGKKMGLKLLLDPTQTDELTANRFSIFFSIFLGNADYRNAFSSVIIRGGWRWPFEGEPLAMAAIERVVSLPSLEHVELDMLEEYTSVVLKMSKQYANLSGRCDPFTGFGLSPNCELECLECSDRDIANFPLFRCHKSLLNLGIYARAPRVNLPIIRQNTQLQEITIHSDLVQQNDDLLLAILGNKKLRCLKLEGFPQDPQVWRRILLDSPSLECLEVTDHEDIEIEHLPRDALQLGFRHTQLRRLSLDWEWPAPDLASFFDILALRPTGTPLQELEIVCYELPFPYLDNDDDDDDDDDETKQRKTTCLASIANLMEHGSFATVKLGICEVVPQALETVLAGVRSSQHLQNFELSISYYSGLSPAIGILEAVLPTLPEQLTSIKYKATNYCSLEYAVADSERLLGSFLTAVTQSEYLESFEVKTGLTADVEANATAKVGIIINHARRMGSISPGIFLKIMAKVDLAVAPLSPDKQSFLKRKVAYFCLQGNPEMLDPLHRLIS